MDFSTSNKSPGSESLAVGVSFSHNLFTIALADGRQISVPLEWSSRLLEATAEQRKNWRLISGGVGIHWNDIDEDILVESVLRMS